MKTVLQNNEKRTQAVPIVRARSRWLKFLVVLMLLATNAGVVNAANGYWYEWNRGTQEGPAYKSYEDIAAEWSSGANPHVTNIWPRDILLHIPTYDDGGGHMEYLTVSIEGTTIFTMGNTEGQSEDNRYGRTTRKWHLNDLILKSS